MNRNSESKLSRLREILDLDLDRGCKFMVQVNRTVKRLEHNRCLLTPKRDKALETLEETYNEAEMLLKNLYKSKERDIMDAYRKKEALLVSDINELVRIINETAEVCGKMEEVMEVGKEYKLLQNGEQLEDKMEKLLLSGKPTSEEELSDIMELEFLPNEGIRQRFGNKALLGYVKKTCTGSQDILSPVHDERESRPVSGVPQKRPVPAKERKRAVVSRGALQGIKNHIKSNPFVNQSVADAMMKEELPSPPQLHKFSQSGSQPGCPPEYQIKAEPISPPYNPCEGNPYTTENSSMKTSPFSETLGSNRDLYSPPLIPSYSRNQQLPEGPSFAQSGGANLARSSVSPPPGFYFGSTKGQQKNNPESSFGLHKDDSSKGKEARYIPPQLRGGGDNTSLTPEKMEDEFVSNPTGHVHLPRVRMNRCDNVQNWRQSRDSSMEKKRRLIDPTYWENSLPGGKAKGEPDVKTTEKASNAAIQSASGQCTGKPEKQEKHEVINAKSYLPDMPNQPKNDSGYSWGNTVSEHKKAVGSLCDAISEVKLHTGGKVEFSEVLTQKGNGSVSSHAWKDKIKADSFKCTEGVRDKCSQEPSDHNTSAAGGRHSRMRFPRTDRTSNIRTNKLDNNNNLTLPGRPPRLQPGRDGNFQGFGQGSSFQFNFLPEPLEGQAKQDDMKKPMEECNDSNVGDQIKESLIEQNLKSGAKVIKADFVRRIGKSGSRELNFPIGVTTTVKNNIIVCNSGLDNVKIFDWGGNLKNTLHGGNQENMVKPSAVIADENEDLYIKDNKHIWVFTIKGSFVQKFGSTVLKRPYGLAFNSEGNIVLLNYDYKDVCILVFSKKGNLLQKSLYSPISNFDIRSRSRCRFLDLIPKENILVVSDLGVSEIFLTDLQGNLVSKFGSFGSIPGQFREPSGIAADQCGNLVIADSKNDRIQVYSRVGHFLASVMLEKERPTRPSDIHLTPDGYLLVSNLLGHSVIVYKIKACST